MDRRDFIKSTWGGLAGFAVTALSGCGKQLEGVLSVGQGEDGSRLVLPGRKEITLYDTNAMALYFDGGLGPKTGIIRVDAIVASLPLKLKFWHGHGGKDHEFTVLPEHFATLKKLKRATVTTSMVDGHSHKLFIDPVDARYRVSGAKPVVVIVED